LSCWRSGSLAHKRKSWLRLPEAAVIAAFALILGALFWNVHVGSRLRLTCVLCRAERTDYRYLGLSFSRQRDTACAEWYRLNVEAVHEHAWDRQTCSTLINMLGVPVGVSCDERGHAIWSLEPEYQIAVYQHFGDRRAAKRLFLSLLDAGLIRRRGDREIIRSLKEWVEAGCVEPWTQPPENAAIPP
jgi:hypothetical protein